MVVEDILCSHPGVSIYIRGDTNSNPNHPSRPQVLQEFMDRYGLSSIPLIHSTYHHFTGDRVSDSQMDVLISSNRCPDRLVVIKYKKDNPLITSSHDLIVSSFKLCPKPHLSQPTPKAPRVIRPRFRVLWDDHGIPLYSSILDQMLPPILALC